MTPSSLIIVADRGSLKAYRVEETHTRGPSLQLVHAFEYTAEDGKLVDLLKEEAGGLRVNNGSKGRHMSPVTDWPELESETNRRIYKQLADRIAKIVESDGVEGWSFAAAASIHAAIVDLLPAEIRGRIVEHVKSDLVKTEASKLPEHFRSLQPI